MRKFFPFFLLSIGMLVQTTPAPLQVYSLEPAGLTISSLPPGSQPTAPSAQTDLDGDGMHERLSLQNAQMSILTDGRVAWSSPEDWTIVQAEITDLDRDEQPEVTMLVWRPFRSWPVDQWLPRGGRIDGFQDANGFSCQIILIGWRGGRYREVWAGSALAEPVQFLRVADLDGDHKQELVTLEGSYSESRSAPAQSIKVWKWNGFGFSVVYALRGTFAQIALAHTTEGRTLILVP